jgi:hypothetical protein
MNQSNILSLPPELLARAFSYLANERPNISNYRLVCRIFLEVSSSFLITTIVFAKRLETIRRLQEIAEHPYFSRHVTDLVWDASSYSDEFALGWNEYVSECLNAPRSFRLSLKDSAARRDLVQPEWQAIQSFVEPLSDGDEGIKNNLFLRPQSIEDEDITSEQVDSLYEYLEMHDAGWDEAFASYRKLFLDELEIDRLNMARRVLRQAFSRMPKLRNVHYTDYRSLARSMWSPLQV